MALLDDILAAEGTGKNPRSSANGTGQFIDSTYLQEIKRQFPQIAAGKTDQQLLAMKADPQYADLNRQLTNGYAQANQAYLSSKGLPVTPGTTYLAHFAGPGGAAAALANPSAPVEQTLGQAAVDANPQIKGMTGADLAKWADARVNGQPGQAAAPAQPSPAPTAAPAASGGLLASLGVQNPFGGTGGALAQPVNVPTPFGNLKLSGAQQVNPALQALNNLQPEQPLSMAGAPPQRKPVDLSSLAALSQPIRLG